MNNQKKGDGTPLFEGLTCRGLRNWWNKNVAGMQVYHVNANFWNGTDDEVANDMVYVFDGIWGLYLESQNKDTTTQIEGVNSVWGLYLENQNKGTKTHRVEAREASPC
jgi:hypothetical protein